MIFFPEMEIWDYDRGSPELKNVDHLAVYDLVAILTYNGGSIPVWRALKPGPWRTGPPPRPVQQTPSSCDGYLLRPSSSSPD